MSFTSAQSGENYRNWWPHPTMTKFTNHSIKLMEDLSRKTDNCLLMTRRITGDLLPDYAVDLSLDRYGNNTLMEKLKTLSTGGLVNGILSPIFVPNF